jgi:hypothetical protein
VTGRSPSEASPAVGQASDVSGIDWPAPAGAAPSRSETAFTGPLRVEEFTSRTLEKPLAEIPQLDMDALRQAWADRFGRPPPKTLSRRLLELAAAYDTQAKVYGGLKPAIRRKLLQAAPTKPDPTAGASHRKTRATLRPGSRLVREWHGRSHTVEVAETGFLYAGRRYRSLSEIARAITGARWSGPRFFGL